MISVNASEKLVASMLSKKRMQHVYNVRDMALQLAKIYKVDQNKAEIAALLHDIVKEKPDDYNLQLISEDAIIQTSEKGLPRQILHAPAAAVYAKKELGITDEELLNAIAYHATGRENMTVLDKIIFLADKISKERDYDGVEALREMALSGKLNEAVLKVLENSIVYIKENGREVEETTLKAYQYLSSELVEG